MVDHVHGGTQLALLEDMTTEEWLAVRRAGIGGSDVAGVVGVSKWSSPYSLWSLKTGRVEDVELDSEPIYWGNTLEHIVLAEIPKRVPGLLEVTPGAATYRHEDPEKFFMLANPDGFGWHQDLGTVLVECKTTGCRASYIWDDDAVPEYYELQVQHYLEVLDLEWAVIAALLGGQTFVYRWIKRDRKLMEDVISLEKQFWETNVLGDHPPALTALLADSDALRDRFKGGGAEKTLDDNVVENLGELQQIKADIKKLKEQERFLSSTIKLELGDNEVGVDENGDKVVTWKTAKSGRRTFRTG